MTVHDLGDGVLLHSRDEWATGGRQVHGDPGSRAVADINEFIVHHSGGVTLGDPDPFQWARNIYDAHRARGYAAEAYEAFVTFHQGQGFILEGRPIGLVSAATRSHNQLGYAACYLRANQDQARDFIVPPVVKVAYRKLAQVIAFTVGRQIRGTDHQDCSGNSTECAGADLNGWVRSGGLWEPFHGPVPHPHPAPPVVWPPFPGVVLKLGSRGGVVAIWQTRMDQLGYHLGVDGVFGAATAEVTRQFQAAHHLVADGIVGRLSWTAAG